MDASSDNTYGGDKNPTNQARRGKVSTSRRLATFVLVLSILFIIPYSLHPSSGETPPVISIFNETTKSNNTADPSLTIGTNFTIDIQVSNLPSITSQTAGGLEGFDISLSFDPNILKTSNSSFSAPLCPSSEGCVFDLPANDTLTYANSVSVEVGTARLAMIALGANHRAVDSSQTGIPTILFRAKFLVVGKGLTPITILSSSQLLGFANNFCSLTHYSPTSGSFDNRPPYTVSATPPSLTVSAGMSISTTINVTATRMYETVNATLLVSGLVLESHSTYTLNHRSEILSQANPSFTSTLTITTQVTSAPQIYPLEIIAAEPLFPAAYNEFRLPFNLTITAPGTSLPTQPPNSPNPPQPQTTLPREQAVDGSTPPLLATFTFSSRPTAGNSVSFSSTIWCGTAPYSYSWSLGDGSKANNSLFTHTYSSPGTYNVTLTATDATGQGFSSSQLIVVGALPQPAAPLDIGVFSTAIILFLILVGSLFFLRSRRKSRR